MFQLGAFLSLHSFGESHGNAIGGVVSNFPAGISIDLNEIQNALDRRRPGQSSIVTQRKESDIVQLLSGVYDGVSTGQPIGFLIPNENTKSKDYDHIENAFRPSHADFTYQQKFGIRDHRGGGRSSARETANWVVAGALAKHILPQEVKINAFVSSVGDIHCPEEYTAMDLANIEATAVRCPHLETAEKMIQRIKEVKKKGDTIGGVITGVIQNLPVGIGEPIFGKLQAQLAHAMMSINAAKGFEYGSGFAGTAMLGSEHNDAWNSDFSTKTNYSGGIQGGISNGMDVYFRVAFKPVATLLQKQESYDIHGRPILLEGKGRHDPCVLPRAVPIVEALAQFIIADLFLIHTLRKI